MPNRVVTRGRDRAQFVLDQIGSIADDPGLRAEVLRQDEAQFQNDLDELLTEQRGL